MFAAKARKWIAERLGPDADGQLLTARERRFCLHYLECYNAARAAVKAGFPKEKAAEAGLNLLKNPNVIAEIMSIRSARSLALELCQADIVERYMAIAFADVTDYVAFGSETLDVEGKPPKTVNFMRLKDSEAVDGAIVSQIAVDGDKLSVKTEDRMKALEWLSEYFKLNHMNRMKLKTEKMKLSAGADDNADRLKIEIRRKEGCDDETERN